MSCSDVADVHVKGMISEVISDPGWSFIVWAGVAGEDGAVCPQGQL